jgi:hypothetical protein
MRGAKLFIPNARSHLAVRGLTKRVARDECLLDVTYPDPLGGSAVDQVALDDKIVGIGRRGLVRACDGALHEDALDVAASSLHQDIVADDNVVHVAERAIVPHLDHVGMIPEFERGMEVGEGVRFDHHVAHVGENGAVAADVFERVPYRLHKLGTPHRQPGFQVVEARANNLDMS